MPTQPEVFYLDAPAELLSQGDIFVAPAVVAWSSATQPAPPLVPLGPATIGARALVPAWSGGPAAAHLPEVTLETQWSPVLVLSHDCEINKEFNEYVDSLVREGVDPAEAEDRASARDDLDRFILVSPLLPFHPDIVPEPRWETIRANRKIGYFSLPPIASVGGSDFFIHLSRISTVERRLLRRELKAASLADPARALLRFKLAEALASRNLSVVSKLEAAIGRRIEDVRTLKVKRQDASVALVLDDGSELLVGAKADAETIAPERTRRR